MQKYFIIIIMITLQHIVDQLFAFSFLSLVRTPQWSVFDLLFWD